ncbi:MAG TPA: hypothetical protein VMZ29_10905 [Candidatus Bathyarchaeia archaeon]|nr:hypothetical protein [Candidatus Bathyarchaeia archaeon]
MVNITSKKEIEFEIKIFDKDSISEETVTKYYNLIHSMWKEMHPLEPIPSLDSMKQHFILISPLSTINF